MNKRGIALIFSLLVVVVLSILSVSFFFKTITENNLVKRYVNSTRAFWLAEAGIAEAIYNMPNDTSGSIGSSNYTYSTDTFLLSGEYYQIDSTGSVQLPTGDTLMRSVSVVVRTSPVDPNKFQHAIRTTVELDVRGNVDINGPTEEFANIIFSDLFDHTKEDVKSFASNYYLDPPVDVTPVSGLTWVDLSAGQELRISSDTWQGSGILIVNGDAQITGGTFNGILYIIGRLRMSGNPTINGTILAESDTEIVEDTTVTGNVTINYDFDAIANALNILQFIIPEITSWREIQ